MVEEAMFCNTVRPAPLPFFFVLSLLKLGSHAGVLYQTTTPSYKDCILSCLAPPNGTCLCPAWCCSSASFLVFLLPAYLSLPSSSSASLYFLDPSPKCVHTSASCLASISMWCFPLPNRSSLFVSHTMYVDHTYYNYVTFLYEWFRTIYCISLSISVCIPYRLGNVCVTTHLSPTRKHFVIHCPSPSILPPLSPPSPPLIFSPQAIASCVLLIPPFRNALLSSAVMVCWATSNLTCHQVRANDC